MQFLNFLNLRFMTSLVNPYNQVSYHHMTGKKVWHDTFGILGYSNLCFDIQKYINGTQRTRKEAMQKAIQQSCIYQQLSVIYRHLNTNWVYLLQCPVWLQLKCPQFNLSVPFTFTCHIVCPFVKHSFHYSPSRKLSEKHFKAALTELAPGSCLFAPFTG